MDWAAHQADWPMADASQFILCKPHRWHVQVMGPDGDDAATVLLIHGAGGATQSWRHLMPLLAAHVRVVAVDLPGQGFTKSGAQQRLGLTPTAQDIAALCTAQGWVPDAIIGHSAGGAVALELARAMTPAPPVIGINAALGNFKGLAGIVFPVMAKALALVPGVSQVFAATATRPGSLARLIEGTGSVLPPDDLRWYRALVSDRSHLDATLSMMAQWDLDPLLRDLPDHPSRTLLIAGSRDKSVPPDTSTRAADKLPNGTSLLLSGLGHLAHEEAAETVLEPILTFLKDTRVIPS